MQPGPSPDPIPAPPEASSRYRGRAGGFAFASFSGDSDFGSSRGRLEGSRRLFHRSRAFFHGSFTPGLSFAAAEVPQGELEPVSW